MIGIRSALSIRARGQWPHLEAVYMTAPRSLAETPRKLLPRGGRPYMTGRTPDVAPTRSLPRLHPGPQPVDDALRRRIAGLDDEQLLLRRLVRIDIFVVEDFEIDQLLARQIAVGIRQKVRIFRRDVRAVEIVDKLIGFRDVLRIRGDREIVEEHLR